MDEVLCCLPNGKQFRRKDIKFVGNISERQKIAIIMPTVVRKIDTNDKDMSYLLQTLEKLIPQLKNDVALLIFIGDTEPDKIMTIISKIQEAYPLYIEMGRLQVVSLENVKYQIPPIIPPSTYKDDTKRIIWRTRQNLLYSFMFTYARSFGEYILMMEDDSFPVPDMLRRIEKEIQDCSNIEWYHLRFSEYFGEIGIVYKPQILPFISRHLRNFYTEDPCDNLRHKLLLRIFKNQIVKHFTYLGCPITTNTGTQFHHIGLISSINQ
ncbi:Alpha-1,3-mannosyl-glycoprotein 4-beta-N-acetylglucosaminyltransferase A [Thelohanellus kitauei]|uniref:Alpha-1,3-mannosyl-glycoprotein 4-beta-N-acetylglucosaminyltransferase A n=1 Tax=Thelohanellus kitauei TaxID=669202 RepID=A0A0C2IHP6_THEKT|nr:Alpha-1,3-mannosyl-glycoprotein 4-beta-N-acetylglucosaminyltransferase A [Thelohanellus kitauei]